MAEFCFDKRMTNHEEWDEFIDNLFSNAISEYKKTENHERSREKLRELAAQLFKEYPEEQYPLLYKHAAQLVLTEEHQNKALYLQGYKDCVFLLKKLGVLA